ncbi:pseudouridine synthase [Ichthyenterobacterium sp. W332]|uniref:Pseudouridine synthase n=1 Tax=Microcosmobacter mediterraneus TaxID=3075607 RepID=A0ABU2YIM3_9FLAO|nr:pseudouridine synthase [Ichthyenterobacterium sp. W332]MDT0557625.1 pseudouridine synthase [Ichthyenterobacterium sp. W332]
MDSHKHFILHKPFGYLSQFVNNQNKRKNKWLLGELYPFPKGVMPIGRLDQNSEGLLLLTTDGQLSHYINSSGIEKEYYALVDGLITENTIEKLSYGVTITSNSKAYRTKPCKVKLIKQLSHIPLADRSVRDPRHGPTSWISLTLTEGKFRQVRKMTAAVGFPTLRLIRVRIGATQLNLDSGKVKQVEQFQL